MSNPYTIYDSGFSLAVVNEETRNQVHAFSTANKTMREIDELKARAEAMVSSLNLQHQATVLGPVRVLEY